jgi:outer membrane protein
MNKIWINAFAGILLTLFPCTIEAKQWTLKDCINYAIENNITIQKNRLSKQSAMEDVLQSKAALLPSLEASTSQNVTYRPWPETGSATVANGYVQSSVDKTYYNGSYGVNANWTVWNGNRNRNTIKQNVLTAQQAELDSAVTANSIQEQIAQLYVQILYSNDAIKVNQQSLETSKKNEQRGEEMVKVGKMSKADLSQLTAQRAQDEYNIVSAESNLRNYKRQLKQLLQITNDEEFDVAIPTTTEEMALQEIPGVNNVYAAALDLRPEIKNSKLAIESSDLSIKIAKAQNLPTIGVSASAGTNTTSMSSSAWGSQLKTNFDLGAGVTVSIPIFDNRSRKTAVNKAIIQKQSYMLDLRDKQTTLYSNIENYWLEATTNQNKFKAAQTSVKSQQESFDLLSEQFRLGLKNIIELMTGKTNLITAQQNELQSKYLTILNIDLLNFYKTGELK